jgi:hypothetical protein
VQGRIDLLLDGEVLRLEVHHVYLAHEIGENGTQISGFNG